LICFRSIAATCQRLIVNNEQWNHAQRINWLEHTHSFVLSNTFRMCSFTIDNISSRFYSRITWEDHSRIVQQVDTIYWHVEIWFIDLYMSTTVINSFSFLVVFLLRRWNMFDIEWIVTHCRSFLLKDIMFWHVTHSSVSTSKWQKMNRKYLFACHE
jgi:hypothetical protein